MTSSKAITKARLTIKLADGTVITYKMNGPRALMVRGRLVPVPDETYGDNGSLAVHVTFTFAWPASEGTP